MPDAKRYHDPVKNGLYNAGYSAGYDGDGPVYDSMDYSRGYLAGKEQRAEDDAAMASGVLDGLSESERDFLYGIEEKVSDYK